MAPNLTSGNFRIVSLEEGNPPAGVNITLPGLQSVYLGAPVTKWVVRKDGPDTYRFQVGGYGFTGVGGDRVIASIHPEHGVEWVATYRKHQDAYTISPADNTHHGWTAPGPDEDSSRVIRIEIIKNPLIFPPRFLPSQLFRFEQIHG